MPTSLKSVNRYKKKLEMNKWATIIAKSTTIPRANYTKKVCEKGKTTSRCGEKRETKRDSKIKYKMLINYQRVHD